MNTVSLQVAISNTTAAWLDREARGAGTSPSGFASAVLDDAAKKGAALLSAAQLPTTERLRRFDAAMSRVPERPGPPVDASRESIYD
ncbi:MAG TPA: hypothetical protein VN829_04620 [Dongiaceae bacterium]|nr:hypothetical protein [Dongiaceae bacterium]